MSFTPIRTGKFNSSFFVDSGDITWVLRIAPPSDETFLFYERNMMAQEPGIHKILLEKTAVPVAPIVAHDTSRAQIDRDFILMERLPGQPVSDSPFGDTASILRQVGRHLAQAHTITADQHGYIGEHHPMEPARTWADAFRVMWGKLIEDIGQTGHYDGEESRFMLNLLEKHLPAFERDVPATLLHMDIWAQNILVEDNCVTGLVDWDRALWGDPEIEFAVLDYCGISEPAFWEGYGKTRDDSPDARIRRLFYFLYELQKYIVIRHGRSNDPGAAAQYKDQAMRIIQNSFRAS